MNDVAVLAGVSHQTVSRVLNSPELVAPDTRSRVELAIEALGYVRNTVGRSLATRRTRLIGLVTPDDALFGPINTSHAIEQAARRRGYATTLAVVPDGDRDIVQTALTNFRELDVEGVVVVASGDEIAEAATELAARLPVVVIAAGLGAESSLHVVAVDQELGARDATRHLLDLGHRDVMHVAGPGDWFDARARIEGWRRELEMEGAVSAHVTSTSWGPDDGYRVGRGLAAQGEVPSAIFAANDLLALGLVRAFHEAGIRVPADVSIVGFDDLEGTAYWLPRLTTVRQPFDAVGELAITVLMAALDGATPTRTRIPPELIVRDSAAPVR